VYPAASSLSILLDAGHSLARLTPSGSSNVRAGERRNALPLSASRFSSPTDTKAFLANLQQSLADSSKTPDAIFRELAEAARILTNASGTALALRTNDFVVCRARSGQIAPEVGTRLDLESGISGQSFRTGKVLRCDDTKKDDRVDPGVCGHFGIRSVAVVPLRTGNDTFGILEAFSGRPYAFSDRQVGLLSRLVEIAQTVYQQETAEKLPVVPAPTRRLSLREFFTNSSADALPSEILEEPPTGAKRRYWLWVAVATLLILISAVVWISWYEPDEEVAPGEQISHLVTAPTGCTAMLDNWRIEKLHQI
jgi:putative methionine-R-sulfoxide reductase with GAF domain